MKNSTFTHFVLSNHSNFDFFRFHSFPFGVDWQYMPKKIESKFVVVVATIRSRYTLHVLYSFLFTHFIMGYMEHSHKIEFELCVCFFFEFPQYGKLIDNRKKGETQIFRGAICPQLVGITIVLCISGISLFSVALLDVSNETCSHIGISWLNLSILSVFILSFIARITTTT